MYKTPLLFLFLWITFSSINSQSNGQNLIIKNQVIIQLNNGVPYSRFAAKFPSLKLKHLKPLGHSHNIHLFEWESKINSAVLFTKLNNDKNVIATQANYYVDFYGEPNDSLFSEQWNMTQLKMPEVWKFGTGGVTVNGDTIVIAIVDSGFNIDHPDLRPNVWYNHQEIPNNGIDDDLNGYIDDFTGWNFRENSPIHGLSKHGHSVAGLAGAKGNNEIGISGINQNVKLLLLDIITIDEIIAAYEYLYDQRNKYNTTNGLEGAFIVANNASWGIDGVFCDQLPVLNNMYNELGSVGILTAAAPSNNFHNVDLQGDIPVTCSSSSIISVLNTSPLNQKINDSSYGLKSVDIGVPGDDVPSLSLTGYKIFGGNSAAAPQLAGAIGLFYSLACKNIIDKALTNPKITASIFKETILNAAVKFNSLKNFCSTGGRLDMEKGFNILQANCNGSVGDLEIISISPNPANLETKVTFQSSDVGIYKVIIYNSAGQKIRTFNITPFVFGEKYFQINTSEFTAGMYEITIQKSRNIVSSKLIILH